MLACQLHTVLTHGQSLKKKDEGVGCGRAQRRRTFPSTDNRKGAATSLWDSAAAYEYSRTRTRVGRRLTEVLESAPVAPIIAGMREDHHEIIV